MLGITPEQIIENLKSVMESQKHNERLLALTKDPRQADIIKSLIQDNQINIDTLKDLYRQMTCDPLVLPSTAEPTFTSYLEGIKLAIMQKVKQFDRLLYLYYTTTSETIQKVILFQASLILVHLRYLDYLLVKNSSQLSTNSALA
ncbi:hypothetical protein FPZ49_05855 [Paenibacillus cremeus]|uniref:Uncharacterized protein n=2 Tax=Paenibacillus cremeus TaxID=2163881 RepID=A0A559KFU0_9BACL|nr:hypothetical protein FPZ49_05855 [Paenibacillus cremeus]